MVDVEREADRLELGDRLVDLLLGHAGEHEVLQARDADVAAEALGQVRDAAICSPETRPRWTGTPT